MNDGLGNEIHEGDIVRPIAYDAGRGVTQQLMGYDATVVAFRRTRVTIRSTAVVGVDHVGPELLRVVRAVDGRVLRTWGDVHEGLGA